MKKLIYINLIIFASALQSFSQIAMGLDAGASGRDLKITATPTSAYNGTLGGYFFVVRYPSSAGPLTLNTSNEVPSSADIQLSGTQTSGGFDYVLVTSNATPPITWGAGIPQDVVSFNLDGGLPGTSTLAELVPDGDPVGDALISALGIDPTTVYGSDINVDGLPTVNSYSDPSQSFILPIKLRKFTVTKNPLRRSSNLEWASSSEVNGSHFEIERSLDGNDWSYVGRVAAKGNSTVDVNYAFEDNTLPISRTNEEIFYYRLKMVDLDGYTEYSDVRSVRFDNGDNVIVKMGPNPTSNILRIEMSTTDATQESAPINIYDITGKIVLKKTISTNGVSEIDMSNLPNASYNVSIEHLGKAYNNRIIKSN